MGAPPRRTRNPLPALLKGRDGNLRPYLMVGQVLKPQGIRGEIKIKPETDDEARFLHLPYVFLDEQGAKRLNVRAARLREGFVYLRLEGVDSVEAAEALRGSYLYVDRQNAAKLPEGRYFIADLKGLTVQDEAGNVLGRLQEVYQAGGNDVYQVEGARGFLFPALKKVIAQVDLEQGTMTLRAEALEQVAVYDDAD